MPAAPITNTENERLMALLDLEVLDTPPEEEFDSLTNAAAIVCGAPIALISLVDEHRQWFKSNVGLDGVVETHRDLAFCAHAINEDHLFEVTDASRDSRFCENPLVTGEPNIRFYAGAPLRLSNGANVGTLCVIDRVPRALTDQQKQVLNQLARAATKALESRRSFVNLQKMKLAIAEVAKSLAESESDFRALAESSPLGIFKTDEAGSCIYTNERWQQIFGMSLQGSLGEGWAYGIHPEDSSKVFNIWKEKSALGSEFDLTFRTRHPNGRVVHVSSRARPVRNEAGDITGWVGTVEDITQQMLQEESLRKSQSLLNRTGRLAGVGGWELDINTQSVYWSDETCRIHGVEIGYKPQLHESVNFYAPEARPIILNAVKNGLEKGEAWDLELPLIRRDGTPLWVRAAGQVEFSETKTPLRITGVFQNITEQHAQRLKLEELAREIKEQHELMRVTLKSIGDAVITTDTQGCVVWLNPVAERMTGWSSEDAKDKPLAQVFNIINEETGLTTQNPIQKALELGKIVGLAKDTILISKNGDRFGIEDSAAPIKNEAGELLGAVLVFHDVTEQRRMSNEISYRASHDSLTGLLNRTEFETKLQKLLKSAQETQKSHAVMFIDLDQFKIVNDSCGHSVGDQLLQRISKLLSESTRSSDSLARLGGDEFGLILEHCDLDKAERVAENICNKMDAFRFEHDGQKFRIGASIGVVEMNSRWVGAAELMQAADQCCYAAKEAGRNRVHCWRDSDLAIRERHGEMRWVTRIEHALDENRFVLFAQAIKQISYPSDGLHLEVLLRMEDENGEIIGPNAFFPAAERYQLASRIDRWVLTEVIKHLRDLQANHKLQMVCVNLSGQSIGDRAFHRFVLELLSSAGSRICHLICFEITETVAVTNLTDAAIFINDVRQLGAKVALDDFGAGASSFTYLKNLSVDIIKIDGQFVRNVTTDPLDTVAVKCFIDLAKVVGVKTVAEFIDRTETLNRMSELGVDYVQGFLLHQPERLSNFYGDIGLATLECAG